MATKLRVIVVSKKFISISLLLIIFLIGLYILFAGTLVHTKADKVKQQLYAIKTALERYKEDHGQFPTEGQGLLVLIKKDPKGRYFRNDKFLLDPWSNPIQYKNDKSSSDEKIILYSFGQNGIDENMMGDDICWDK